jgi:hypothetical protein
MGGVPLPYVRIKSLGGTGFWVETLGVLTGHELFKSSITLTNLVLCRQLLDFTNHMSRSSHQSIKSQSLTLP